VAVVPGIECVAVVPATIPQLSFEAENEVSMEMSSAPIVPLASQSYTLISDRLQWTGKRIATSFFLLGLEMLKD